METLNKKDLKTGMWVEYRNGDKRMVLLGTSFGDILVGSNGWIFLKYYDKTLKSIEGVYDIDIMKIYVPRHPWHIVEEGKVCYENNIIWEREEKVTIEIGGKCIKISLESAKAIQESLKNILTGE